MYYDEYFPFHAAYINPLLYDGEKIQDEEFELMKSYYPDAVRRIQERVEEECSRLDYEEADCTMSIRISICCIICAGK